MLITTSKGTKEYPGENPSNIEEFKKTLDSLLLEMKFTKTEQDFTLYELENLAVILYTEGTVFLPYQTSGISLILEGTRIKIPECNMKLKIETHNCYNIIFDILRIVWKCYKMDASEELFINSVGYYSQRLNMVS